MIINHVSHCVRHRYDSTDTAQPNGVHETCTRKITTRARRPQQHNTTNVICGHTMCGVSGSCYTLDKRGAHVKQARY